MIFVQYFKYLLNYIFLKHWTKFV